MSQIVLFPDNTVSVSSQGQIKLIACCTRGQTQLKICLTSELEKAFAVQMQGGIFVTHEGFDSTVMAKILKTSF